MSDPIQMVCPSCGGINRVSVERAKEAKCGHCKSMLFQGMPVDVDAVSFAKHVSKGEVPLLVDFWAPWCGPCKMMAPVFSQAATKLEPQVRLLKVNTEQQSGLAGQFGIRSIPTLMLIHKGIEIDRLSGALDAAGLIAWTEQALKKA